MRYFGQRYFAARYFAMGYLAGVGVSVEIVSGFVAAVMASNFTAVASQAIPLGATAGLARTLGAEALSAIVPQPAIVSSALTASHAAAVQYAAVEVAAGKSVLAISNTVQVTQ